MLGPNGAGKTTTLRILYTVLKPDKGTATVDGYDTLAHPIEVQRRTGALPDSHGLYPRLTARENIRYYGELHGLRDGELERRIDGLIERLGLGEIADRRAKGFSQGERTKVALARALVNEPAYLLLDEPTSGLDVMATRDLRAWLIELKAQGCCIVLSSHVMQEVAALTDEIVIVAHGLVAAQGSAAELAAQFGHEDLEQIFVDAVSRVAP